MRREWRLWLAAGLAIGLAAAPLLPRGADGTAAAALLLAVAGLAVLAPGRRLPLPWLAALGALTVALGATAGAARLAAIDAAALRAPVGSPVAVEGFVAAVPRRSHGMVRVEVNGRRGKLLLEAPEPVPDLAPGTAVRARGTVEPVPDWYRSYLRREGIARIVRSGRIDPAVGRRSGLAGRLDAIRTRAEAALGRGLPRREAALARGFVLGEDDRVDPATVDDFRRSGLSHLLAVSGENVVLLALLAGAALGALGIPLRARLIWIIALVAAYVPLAGGGASIRRAGAMGIAGLLAALAGRPSSRLFVLLAAAIVTLGLNPRVSGDAGWQLSFAAVLGIFAFAAPIRAALGPRFGGRPLRSLVEGAAVSIAATAATGPLIAFHFGALSTTSLIANLLALPAVAPAMWLGMLIAFLGQLPGLPVEPLGLVNGLLCAYVAQVAAWCAAPRWAYLDVSLGLPGLLVSYAALAVAAVCLRLRPPRRRDRRPRDRQRDRVGRRQRPRWLAAAVILLATLALLSLWGGGRGGAGPQRQGLRVVVLDVGQGDAILLQPPSADPVLVDTGPPGDDLVAKLRAAGVQRLGAVVLTHDEDDHTGGFDSLAGEIPIGRLVYAVLGRGLLSLARGAGAMPLRVAQGDVLRAGRLRLDVEWPPGEDPGEGMGGEDPNLRSIVLLARWGSFSMLLTGDAEAEAVPLDPGPIDVLKVSHHGSDDAGLAALLERSRPQLAVISVGAGNPFGHPTPATIATLAAHRVAALRTDRDGEITLDVGRGLVDVATAR